MVKKVLRYLGVVLGLLTCLPLFVAPFALVAKSSLGESSTAVKLFEELDGVKLSFKLFGEDFQTIWITIFQIAVIVALVIAVVMLVVYLLDDLKVIKAQKIEKLLATLLIIVGIVALVSVALCSILNLVSKNNTSLVFTGSVLGWLLPVFAIVGGILASMSVGKKSKKK